MKQLNGWTAAVLRGLLAALIALILFVLEVLVGVILVEADALLQNTRP